MPTMRAWQGSALYKTVWTPMDATPGNWHLLLPIQGAVGRGSLPSVRVVSTKLVKLPILCN